MNLELLGELFHSVLIILPDPMHVTNFVTAVYFLVDSRVGLSSFLNVLLPCMSKYYDNDSCPTSSVAS